MLRENGKGNPARVSTLASQKFNLNFRKGDTMETVQSICDLAAAALVFSIVLRFFQPDG
jgi:hypothetical protein